MAGAVCAYSQSAHKKVYFVDGYHGGIYGHYPVEWKTQFIIDQLALHPEWRIGLEIEPETWDTVRLRTPAAYANFKKTVTDSRIEFTNPAYAQPYCYNVSGESIIRQFVYGIRKIHDHFPEVEFVTYSVEEPCFTSSLPQILKQFGFRYAVLKCPNTCWGGYSAPYGGQLVNWIGPDGTSILTVPRYACEELEKNSVWQTTAWGNSDEYLDACFAYGIEDPVGMCYQDAGWKNGPWLGYGDSIRNNSVYVTWREYMEKVSEGKTDDDYRMSQEDVRPNLMWGSQVLQRIAREVRSSENCIVSAEKMGAIAAIAGTTGYRQEDIDEAWRTLMLAQHHDSWIVPYNRLHKRETWAQAINRWTAAANALSGSLIADMQDGLAGSGAAVDNEGYISVYNTGGTARQEVISVTLPERFAGKQVTVYDAANKKITSYTEASKDKTRLVVEVGIPPFGYSTYRILQNKKVAAAKDRERSYEAGEIVVENSMYRIVVDASKGGIIKSLKAKTEDGKEFAASGDGFALGQLRGYFYDEGRWLSSTDAPACVTVESDNPFEKSVRIEGCIGVHPFTQTVTIREGQRKIDFDLKIDWQGNPGIGEFRQSDAYANNRRAFCNDRFKLNVMFPVAFDAPVLYKDAPFDVCESRLDNTFFNTWDSIKHNVILHWVDLAENDGYGLALFSDHTTSYSCGEEFPLALTAQYSGNGLWGRDYPIDGPLEMKFALVPHSGKWDDAGIQQESTNWNEPLLVSFHDMARPGSRSLIDVTGTGYEISAAYPVAGGIVMRLYNADGDSSAQKVKFGFPVASITEIDLNGDTVTSMGMENNEIEIAMPRFGLKTFLVTK